MGILRIYTDGACSGNQNQINTGGWGAILEYGGSVKELSGNQRNTTNNRMELTAVIEAFKALTRSGVTCHVFTDSAYVADCFRKRWYMNWRKNGWKTAGKKPVENQDLWQELLDLVDKHAVNFFRVKGHVNLDSPKTNLDELYDKFVEWNGKAFSRKEFEYIVLMNNRADELATDAAALLEAENKIDDPDDNPEPPFDLDE